jgi:hypothetical protein
MKRIVITRYGKFYINDDVAVNYADYGHYFNLPKTDMSDQEIRVFLEEVMEY